MSQKTLKSLKIWLSYHNFSKIHVKYINFHKYHHILQFSSEFNILKLILKP